MRVDWLVVGAGFTGATVAERIATQLDRRVLVIDRRSHIGGNAYDERNVDGVMVHPYGPHIFHTSSHKVWSYLSRFTDWRPYNHHVLAVIDGRRVPLPFNLNALDALFSPRDAARLQQLLMEHFGLGARVPILRMRAHRHRELACLAEFIYQRVFYEYTRKQWACTPEQLDPAVTGRVPVSVSRDNRYFQDTFQAIPRHGYTRMFQRMLHHRNIEVLTGTSYRDVCDSVTFDRMVFTGPIDEFFQFVHGPLPYRSVRFEFETLDEEWFQEVGTVNYPSDEAFTRITEQKHITGQRIDKTTIVREYPGQHVVGETEPYYPVPRRENRERYHLYANEAQKLDGTVVFAGRLGDYRYYNMDQAAARGLQLFEDVIACR